MKPTVIKCSKCGYESNIIGDTCIKCGAGLEKICGNCGARVPVEKNYCDECGKLLMLKIIEDPTPPPPPGKESPPKARMEFETFDEAIEARQRSYTGKMAKKAENAGDALTEKMAKDTLKDKDNLSDYARLQEAKNHEELEKLRMLRSKAPKNFWEKNRAFFYVLFGAFIFLFLSYLILTPYLPRLRLALAAKKYLGALNSKDYMLAYDYLSVNSKASCPFTQYLRYNEDFYSKIPSWEFSDVKIHSITSAGAVVKYRIREEKGEWKDDYLSFVLEQGGWARPYVRHLFPQIDAAIADGDFAQALFLSQKLYLTDPVDPRTSGYLCNSEYLARLYDKSVETCKRALDQSKVYPVGFGKEELFWYSFYYADSLRFQGRFSEAVKVYDSLFDFAELSDKNKCPLLMARADAHVREQQYYAAKDDLSSALGACSDGQARRDAEKRLRIINGEAGEDAVFLAQRFRLSPGRPNLMEMRSSQAFSLAGKKKIGKGGLEEKWVASYLEGTMYSVSLRQVKKGDRKDGEPADDIYVLNVNVWTGFVKPEKKIGGGQE